MMTKKIMEPVGKTSGPPTRIRKWNQFNHFRGTSIKVITIGKT